MITATNNYAVQNAAHSFFKLVGELPEKTVIFLQSVTAQLQPVRVTDQVWCNCQTPELLKDLFEALKDTIEKLEKNAIEEYLEKRLGHNGESSR